MKMIAEYLEHALQFERMASEATDPALKESLSKQALAYHKLAEERAERLHPRPPATPYDDSIKRPDCPRCGTRMILARFNLARDKPDHDRRTFECPECGNEISEVVRFK